MYWLDYFGGKELKGFLGWEFEKMIKRFFRLFWHYFKINVAREMEYRANLFIRIIVGLGWVLISLAFFDILYSHTDLVGGWNQNQVLILLGTYGLIESCLYSAFYYSFGDALKRINNGQLDLILLKPVDSQFLLSIARFSLNNSFSGLVLAPLLIIIGFTRLGLSISLVQIVIFVLLVILGVLICYSLWLMIITLAFYSNRLSNINHLFMNLFDFAERPGSIYQGVAGFVFWVFLPVATVVTIPAQVLLGVISWSWIVYLFFFAIFSLWLSHKFWNFSLKRYSGASA